MSDEGQQPQNERQIFNYPGGKSKSRVWKYFGFCKEKTGPPTRENLDMTRAICRLCRKTYMNKGNTTNFQNHLDHDHCDLKAQQLPTCTQKSVATTSQPKLSFAPPRISSGRQETIDDALLQLLVAKVLPVSLVDNQYFVNFVKLLDQRYQIPSRRVVVRKLEKKHEVVKGKVKDDVQSVESIAITHDGWTSLNNESYNTVTAHLVDDSWKLKTVVLETKKMEGSHTGERIAETLLKTKQEWKLPTPIATTDNAANERKAFNILGWARFGCYGHRINLVVRNALSKPEVSKLLGKGRKLVTFFHASSSVTDALVKKQALLLPNKVGHKLIMDVPTRWNSTLAMLERLVEQTPAVVALANDDTISKAANTTIRNCAYSFEEQSTIEGLVTILKPFEKATTILCAEQVPTMHKVIPVVVKLSKSVEDAPGDPHIINIVKLTMRKELLARTDCEDVALAACVLSPYTKGFQFLPEKRQEAHDLIRKLAFNSQFDVIVKTEPVENGDRELPPLPDLPSIPLLEDAADASVPTPTSTVDSVPSQSPSKGNESPAAKKIKSADTEDWLDDVICVGESKLDAQNAAEAEVTRYLGAGVVAGDEGLTLLAWWKKNETYYPRLSKLAKKYIGCQASSVPSERVFSLAGQVVSKKRCRMSPNHVDLLIFLNRNMKTYW